MQRGAFRVISLYANCSISLLLQTREFRPDESATEFHSSGNGVERAMRLDKSYRTACTQITLHPVFYHEEQSEGNPGVLVSEEMAGPARNPGRDEVREMENSAKAQVRYGRQSCRKGRITLFLMEEKSPWLAAGGKPVVSPLRKRGFVDRDVFLEIMTFANRYQSAEKSFRRWRFLVSTRQTKDEQQNLHLVGSRNPASGEAEGVPVVGENGFYPKRGVQMQQTNSSRSKNEHDKSRLYNVVEMHGQGLPTLPDKTDIEKPIAVLRDDDAIMMMMMVMSVMEMMVVTTMMVLMEMMVMMVVMVVVVVMMVVMVLMEMMVVVMMVMMVMVVMMASRDQYDAALPKTEELGSLKANKAISPKVRNATEMFHYLEEEEKNIASRLYLNGDAAYRSITLDPNVTLPPLGHQPFTSKPTKKCRRHGINRQGPENDDDTADKDVRKEKENVHMAFGLDRAELVSSRQNGEAAAGHIRSTVIATANNDNTKVPKSTEISGMRGAFGKPQGTVARVHTRQVIMSTGTKLQNEERVIEAKFKFPGHQKIHISKKWGFTRLLKSYHNSVLFERYTTAETNMYIIAFEANPTINFSTHPIDTPVATAPRQTSARVETKVVGNRYKRKKFLSEGICLLFGAENEINYVQDEWRRRGRGTHSVALFFPQQSHHHPTKSSIQRALKIPRYSWSAKDESSRQVSLCAVKRQEKFLDNTCVIVSTAINATTTCQIVYVID
ncbi:hypothetical protein EI555_006036 [Monodon monoceros]|uniref:Ribosomal protein L10e/L16 domain-containing protein n=1 Tax=Monodon monoceros TaxID=40151 RepID=A0A4U1F374_MONMO|nr:hypothetical protein EI555_006036 [Monodon monoceros]